ncbi:hypothetical protein AG1IA_01956 [Rhizoctonia solani AG-1 IA]|uniref:Uncharacterized protein n=1 Tax=Thanatephorus cucumeris (strain AG1-IA) TaxID=983506 RepID=L8X4Q2_THACA|nr:hypothetical protein AG1IA_01956 [Rhizoctonia solani AG-1 IA]
MQYLFDRQERRAPDTRALFSLLHPSRLVPALPLISTGLQPNPPLRVCQLVMSMGPSILTVHERPNGDIGLALPNQTGDMYVLRGSAKPGPKGSRSTQDIVRCKDDMVLASVAWVDPKKDMIKIEKAAYMTEGERCGSWIPLGEAWKSAAPAKGDCTEQFNGSDRRPYEWKLELRNLHKTEHIAVETQFTPKGHVLEMNPVDCVGVGEMLYVTLLVGLARRRHKRKHGLPGVVSRVVENVLFM